MKIQKGTSDPEIVLASASPRRRDLLHMLADDFRAVSTDADESFDPSLPPEKVAVLLSGRKVSALDGQYPKAVVIGCDTVVALDSQILGKPRGRADARRMLELLSGRTHQVVTGVTLRYGQRVEQFYERTAVSFRSLDDEAIEAYIQTDEPYDKAGSYGIQGRAGDFVREVAGDYYTVVGLPVQALWRYLTDLGIQGLKYPVQQNIFEIRKIDRKCT